MLWLALMSVIQNKHRPMLESRQYAVRHSQVCVVRVRNYTTASFFTASGFENDPILSQFWVNFKANNGYFLATFR